MAGEFPIKVDKILSKYGKDRLVCFNLARQLKAGYYYIIKSISCDFHEYKQSNWHIVIWLDYQLPS